MPKKAVGVSGYERTRNGRPETVGDYIRMQQVSGGSPAMKALRRKGGKSARRTKPQIESIKIVVGDDDNPDLSFLGEYASTDKGNPLAIDRVERGDAGRNEYRYFIPARAANAQEAEQDYDRMEAYNRGDWHMVGIYAQATVLVPDQFGNFNVQQIRSGGLWGVESDSDMDYRRQTASEEVMDLVGQLEALGIDKWDVDDTEIDDTQLG